MREVFISYKSFESELGNNDEAIANELCEYLEHAGITCWIAPRDIDLGVKGYARSIMDAIEECKVFLLVFSRHANESEYVASEVDAAFAAKKDIIPFSLDNTVPNKELKFYLGRKQWVYAQDGYRDKFPELIAALSKRLDRASTIKQGSHILGEMTQHGSKKILRFEVDGIVFNMIHVDGGTFTMGATPEQMNDAVDDEKPEHKVTLPSFYIGETQVTQVLWESVMKSNPSYFKGDLRLPVESVTWNDCQHFIKKLNHLTGREFHLPTEAQWEFAARGGRRSQGYIYAGSNNINQVAWYANSRKSDLLAQKQDTSNDWLLYDMLNSVTSRRFQLPGDKPLEGVKKFPSNEIRGTYVVASKSPNELGLYDLSGNVWEWCHDVFRKYSSDEQGNPAGTYLGDCRVIRGGSCDSSAKLCRVSYRNSFPSDDKSNLLGMRLAL